MLCIQRRTTRSIHALGRRRFTSTTISSSTKASRPCQATLTLPENISKDGLLDALSDRASYMPSHATASVNGLVLLATPSLATWLEDETFMSSALARISRRSVEFSQGAANDVEVVAAVVEGVLSNNASPSPSGISILGGCFKDLVPDLSWATSPPPSRDSADALGSLSFSFHNTGVSARRVTLPLANTVFQNGHTSTLLASRWKATPNGGLKLENMVSKRSLDITHPSAAPQPRAITYSAPLVPITPARWIVSSFGNIIRQVEAHDTPVPASQELETIIPKLVAARGLSKTSGPMAVWALVIPPGVDAAEQLPLLTEPFEPERESDIVQRSSAAVSELLGRGCRLHQLLSGGGGWGKKQGLLALDPELSAAPSGDEGADMLMQSLLSAGGEADPSFPGGGLIAPGSSVQFLASPAVPRAPLVGRETRAHDLATASAVFGVAPTDDGEGGGGAPFARSPAHVTYSPGTFGALATKVFVEAGGAHPHRAAKLNVPFATLRI